MSRDVRPARLDLRRAIAAVAVAIAGCGAAPDAATPARAASARTAFVGVTVITMETTGEAGARLEDQTVLVSGGLVEAVGPRSRIEVPRGAKTIDGRGKFLVPGLVDMHVHLVHAQHLPLYVARGVTTVRNMWGGPIHLAWREEIERGERLGPRIRTVGPIVDGAEPVHDGSFVARTPEDADRAVALHVTRGYDFVKAYGKLEPAVFDALTRGASAAHLRVVGHVPREVGLLRSLDAGLFTVEHTNTFYDALQADDSPVKGKTDRASRRRWVDHLDESKLAAIAERFVARQAWACPTRVVMRSSEPVAAQRERLARPESRYVLPSERAVWAPGDEPPEEERKRDARELEIADAIVRELHRRGVGIVAGTDVGNPLVVPGYALHDELAELVRLGFTPYEALRSATRDAAEVLGMSDQIGTVTKGKKADLVLLASDPTADIRSTTRIDGVVARGRWIGADEDEEILAFVARWAEGTQDPFAERPALEVAGSRELSRARFRVTWKGVPFDAERMLVETGADGAITIHGEAFDPHEGQWYGMTASAADRPLRLVLEGDGAVGTGRVTVTRPEPSRLHAEGTALSGDRVLADVAVDPEAVVVVPKLLSGLAHLPVDREGEVKIVALSLGGALEAEPATWKISPGEGEGRVQIETGKGSPRLLQRDASGQPIGLSMTSHGGPLVWVREP